MPQLVIKEAGIKGRGVFAVNTIRKGNFICEYKTYRPPYPRSQKAAIEKEYIFNGEGCYIVEAKGPDGWVCFDATRSLNQYGRYINHSPGRLANAKLANPILYGGKLRLGVVALRDIVDGEEIVYDYGVRGETWLTYAGKLSTYYNHMQYNIL